jgi:hypothetical protein
MDALTRTLTVAALALATALCGADKKEAAPAAAWSKCPWSAAAETVATNCARGVVVVAPTPPFACGRLSGSACARPQRIPVVRKSTATLQRTNCEGR